MFHFVFFSNIWQYITNRICPRSPEKNDREWDSKTFPQQLKNFWFWSRSCLPHTVQAFVLITRVDILAILLTDRKYSPDCTISSFMKPAFTFFHFLFFFFLFYGNEKVHQLWWDSRRELKCWIVLSVFTKWESNAVSQFRNEMSRQKFSANWQTRSICC